MDIGMMLEKKCGMNVSLLFETNQKNSKK
jgi:hypothetical protein